MALAVRETSPAMREAARFLHYLRHNARSDGRYSNSSRLRSFWANSETRDTDRFRDVCETVTRDFVFWCDDCSDPVWEDSWHGTTGEDTEVCHRCLGEYYYCSRCEQYYSESHKHETGSVCDVPHPRFRFPLADGRTVGSDDIIDVETAAGLISDRGMREIAEYLYDKISDYWIYSVLTRENGDFDHEWTNKSGNFTKRVAKLALQNGVKIAPDVLSEVGNLARAHTASGKRYRVEFTRDLNAPAADFYHESSCWWTDYAESRCALKQCGGLGIRTFNSYDRVTGRAWVLPLSLDGNRPWLTSDPMDADAFVVFNAYGHDGYEFARILSQLTGFSYRKITFHCSPMYVNGGPGIGFLVAPVQVCEHTDELSFSVNLNCECDCD